MTTNEGWGTIAEKRFLDGLGRHSLEAAPRAALLQGYIDALGLRFRWGGIDRYAVATYAATLLRMETEEGARHG